MNVTHPNGNVVRPHLRNGHNKAAAKLDALGAADFTQEGLEENAMKKGIKEVNMSRTSAGQNGGSCAKRTCSPSKARVKCVSTTKQTKKEAASWLC